MNMIGVMLDNNRSIAKTRSERLATLRSFTGGKIDKAIIAATSYGWMDLYAKSSVVWNLPNRIATAKRFRSR